MISKPNHKPLSENQVYSISHHGGLPNAHSQRYMIIPIMVLYKNNLLISKPEDI